MSRIARPWVQLLGSEQRQRPVVDYTERGGRHHRHCGGRRRSLPESWSLCGLGVVAIVIVVVLLCLLAFERADWWRAADELIDDDGGAVDFHGGVGLLMWLRAQSSNEIQQEITGRVQRKLVYEVTGNATATSTTTQVNAAIYIQGVGSRNQTIGIANTESLFLHDVLYGVNIIQKRNLVGDVDGLNGWFALGSCKLSVNNNGMPRVLPPMAKGSLGSMHEPFNVDTFS
ncbi:hypothetical protein Cni_G20347 [Canna indica]|uniref:Uncharacterized protein n=1 Tax=Canna indica TaxID=4628 RepID=A0AAQ3KMH6_9LILI|nr:hypothetical protein Cni_G20347 [Canna indica]